MRGSLYFAGDASCSARDDVCGARDCSSRDCVCLNIGLQDICMPRANASPCRDEKSLSFVDANMRFIVASMGFVSASTGFASVFMGCVDLNPCFGGASTC